MFTDRTKIATDQSCLLLNSVYLHIHEIPFMYVMSSTMTIWTKKIASGRIEMPWNGNCIEWHQWIHSHSIPRLPSIHPDARKQSAHMNRLMFSESKKYRLMEFNIRFVVGNRKEKVATTLCLNYLERNSLGRQVSSKLSRTWYLIRVYVPIFALLRIHWNVKTYQWTGQITNLPQK